MNSDNQDQEFYRWLGGVVSPEHGPITADEYQVIGQNLLSIVMRPKPKTNFAAMAACFSPDKSKAESTKHPETGPLSLAAQVDRLQEHVHSLKATARSQGRTLDDQAKNIYELSKRTASFEASRDQIAALQDRVLKLESIAQAARYLPSGLV